MGKNIAGWTAAAAAAAAGGGEAASTGDLALGSCGTGTRFPSRGGTGTVGAARCCCCSAGINGTGIRCTTDATAASGRGGTGSTTTCCNGGDDRGGAEKPPRCDGNRDGGGETVRLLMDDCTELPGRDVGADIMCPNLVT